MAFMSPLIQTSQLIILFSHQSLNTTISKYHLDVINLAKSSKKLYHQVKMTVSSLAIKTILQKLNIHMKN